MCLGTIRGCSDERQRDGGCWHRAELNLGFFCRLAQPLQRLAIAPQVNAFISLQWP